MDMNSDSDSDASFSGFDTDDVDAAAENAHDNLYDFSDIEISSVSSIDSSDSESSDSDAGYDVGYEPKYKIDPPVWTRNYQYVHVPQFSEPTGPRLPANFDTNSACEIDYFSLYFTDDLFEQITRNTNIYAQFVIDQKKRRNPNYRDKNWQKDVSTQDMKAYYGLCFIFGLNPSPRYKMYWSRDPFLGNPGVQSTMTKTLYEKITEYLHVSDRRAELPRNAPNHDHLQKVRILLDHMGTTFPKYMRCTQEQAIDEGMVAFTGRHFARQFLPQKPHRYGLKLWCR